MDGGAGTEDLLDFSDGTVAVNFTLVQSAASTSITNGTGGLGNNDTYQNIEGVIGTSLRRHDHRQRLERHHPRRRRQRHAQWRRWDR